MSFFLNLAARVRGRGDAPLSQPGVGAVLRVCDDDFASGGAATFADTISSRRRGRATALATPLAGSHSMGDAEKTRGYRCSAWRGLLEGTNDVIGRRGLWRGFASRSRRGGGGGRRNDDEDPPFEVMLTGSLRESSTEDILWLVDRYGDEFNSIHVSTAINTMYKVASPDPKDKLDEDERFLKLIDLVRSRCKSFRAQAIANVLHGLAVLEADYGWRAVDEELAEELVRVAEREAHDMTPQGVAMTLNALGKLEVASSEMTTSGWRALARRSEAVAPMMNPQGVANMLNALSKLDVAASQMSTSGWGALARAAEDVSPKVNPQDISNTLAAYGHLPTAAANLSPSCRARLEAAAVRTAPSMNSQDRKMTVFGCQKLGIKIPPALQCK